MEYPMTLVDTSLDLNSRPLQLLFNEGQQFPKSDDSSGGFYDRRMKIRGVKREGGDLAEELNRVSAENKKLTEMLVVMCENYNALQSRVAEFANKSPGSETPNKSSRKRKAEDAANNDGDNDGAKDRSESTSSDCEDSCKKPREEHIKGKISRVCFRTQASDPSLIVKDGYHWRKYGQKVTRDNPSPRAYFKCSFAPSCPVKKKVQKSVEDQTILVATYEGEHNHPNPTRQEQANLPPTRSSTTTASPVPGSGSSGRTVTLDLTSTSRLSQDEAKVTNRVLGSPNFEQFLVDQMASSLTKDPNFKAALAAAISGRILQHNQAQKW